MTRRAVDVIEEALARPNDADEALREVVRVLADEPGIGWAGIAFVEAGALVLGPSAGVEDPSRRKRATISFKGEPVGELRVDGDADEALLARIARLLSAHVLLGWDTAGEAWEP
ncbi:MAG TPA: hypothetical protein VFO26_04755 [Gaiella sp.]|uniref:hypothetical protein n=1 Tax=Gaiella sp. TaxID=2663207 RepID=UPI002D80B224|nr:hypothetical protein [Gaiella sp.]HET9286847.1 hypothetical protein [Gaiella sp.]